MALEIVFLDGPPLMEVGTRTRIRVMQRDADGQQNPMLLKDVAFSYSPMEWGRVEPTGEPAVGLLEVVRLVESDDVLLAPTYSISASLTHFTGHTFQAERRVRLLATAVEVELAFEVGQNGKWKRFAAADLRQPLDWAKARIGDPATQSLLVRDGKPYSAIAHLAETVTPFTGSGGKVPGTPRATTRRPTSLRRFRNVGSRRMASLEGTRS